MSLLGSMGDFMSDGVGSLVSAGLNFLGAKDTNETNMALGREQMAFQERMSSSAYQRAVADMQKAGLNPMLAYSQGGASSPVGSMPQVQNAMGAALSGAAQAASVMQGLQQIKFSEAQTEKTLAEAARTKAETLTADLYSAQGWSNLLQTHEATRKLWTGGERDLAERDLAEMLQKLRKLELQRDTATFSADVARRKSESLTAGSESVLRGLEIPRSKAEAQFYERIGQGQPWLRMLLEIMKGARGGR